MFFTFSKRKLWSIIIVSTVLLLGAALSIVLNNKFRLTETANLNFRSTIATFSYWVFHEDDRNPLNLLASVFGFEGEVQDFQQGETRSVPVLAYHGLPNEGLGQIPQSVFIDQMKSLHAAGWRTTTLEQFYQFMQGETDLPERSFLLTFDDGRKDTFYPADPVLKDLGFNAVMFAISKKSSTPSESTYYLSDFELLQMERSGRWEIASHGRDSHDWYYIDGEGGIGHFFSNRLWLSEQNRIETVEEFRQRIVYDLSRSKSDFEGALGKEMKFFAFPFGDFGHLGVNYEGAEAVVAEELPKIYELAFFQIWDGMGEIVNYPNRDLFMIKRIEPHFEWDGATLLRVLESSRYKNLPYESGSFGLEWRSGWGYVEAGESLRLAASDTGTGASAALSGSFPWQNYSFSIDADWQNGSNVVLVARRGDDHNYYGCNFGRDKVYIKRSLDGVSQNIVEQSYDVASLGRKISLGVEVSGASVGCLVNGVSVVRSEVNFRWSQGGVGLEVWDANNGRSDVIFDNVSIQPI